MSQITKEAIEALESARAHILDAYRIWQADDVSAVPPTKSGAGAVIAKIDAVLSTLPIAGEGKVSLLKRMSGLLDDLSPDETIGFSNGIGWIDVATVEEIRNAAYSSPGKDGGQEVEAVAKLVYEAMRIAAHECDPDREKPQWVEGGNSLMQDQARRIARAISDTQPASTALVERLERERDYAVRWANKAVADVKEHDDAIIQKLKLALETINGSEGLMATELRAIARAALSASTSREGESR